MVEEHVFLYNWKEFVAWIHKKIDGDFSWKIRSIDTRKSREVIIESIDRAIKNNNGVFPDAGDMFIEKISKKK
jgi:hypothetical protein